MQTSKKRKKYSDARDGFFQSNFQSNPTFLHTSTPPLANKQHTLPTSILMFLHDDANITHQPMRLVIHHISDDIMQQQKT